MPVVNRRAFLVASLALPVASLACGSASISLEQFVSLSERLVGRTNLPIEAARDYLTALQSDPANGQLLAGLAGPGADTPAHAALERLIIEAWYTGAVVVNGTVHATSSTNALVWGAMGRTPLGVCGGATGYWADRPPTTAS